MKNRILSVLILLLCLGVLFVSCGEADMPTNAETDTEAVTDAITANDPAATETELQTEAEAQTVSPVISAECTVDFVKEETEIYDESGKLLLLSGQFIYPVVTIPENPSAESAVNAYFAAEKDKYYAEAEKMHADSLELLGNFESEYWNTFIYDKKYSLELVNSEHLSFLLHTDIYLGGAHPTPDESGVIFDLTDGHVLGLDELFTDVDAMRAHVLPIIKSEVEKGEPFENYEEFLPYLVDDGTFYLDGEGVTFICNVYVLFPYVNGISYYTIPYEELNGYLSFEMQGSASFSRFYSFDLDGKDGENVLGYVDTREFSCPYDETERCTVNGEERHGCYIVPKHPGSSISIEHILYDGDGNETGTEVYKTFKNTAEDFCLGLVCPMYESRPLYRAVITYGDRTASIDLIYSISTERPVKLIKE